MSLSVESLPPVCPAADFCFLKRRVHAHVLSASDRMNSGRKNHSSDRHIFLPSDVTESLPSGSLSSGADSSSSYGSWLWLHLPITTPSFSNSSPGLLLTIVFSVVSSVKRNGYSAPVMSRQRSIALALLAVRQ